MNTILIQVLDSDQWQTVTKVQYDPQRSNNKRVGDTMYFNRLGAIKQAFRHMADWQASDQFIGKQLRVGEMRKAGRDDVFDAITRVPA